MKGRLELAILSQILNLNKMNVCVKLVKSAPPAYFKKIPLPNIC